MRVSDVLLSELLAAGHLQPLPPVWSVCNLVLASQRLPLPPPPLFYSLQH